MSGHTLVQNIRRRHYELGVTRALIAASKWRSPSSPKRSDRETGRQLGPLGPVRSTQQCPFASHPIPVGVTASTRRPGRQTAPDRRVRGRLVRWSRSRGAKANGRADGGAVGVFTVVDALTVRSESLGREVGVVLRDHSALADGLLHAEHE